MTKADKVGLTPRSFAAEMARNPIQHHTRWFVGVDPDGHNTGLAWAQATWTTPMTGPVKIESVRGSLVRIPPRMRGLDAADAMVDTLGERLREVATLIGGHATLVAEAQQIYAREEMPRAEIVAKANDLLKLGLVTGAALAFARQYKWAYTSELPADWKQQKKKEAHHSQIVRRLGDVQDVQFDTHRGLKGIPAIYGHAMDALGLALWAADRAAAGTLAAFTPSR